MDVLIPVCVGYGVGSLPLGFLIANRLKGIDLRRVGSGNVGAANVYRTAGLAIALLVIAIIPRHAGNLGLVVSGTERRLGRRV